MSGKFALAFDFDKASENEKAIHTIMADNGDIIKITQIAGLLARRITYDNKRIGDTVKVGDRMGMIHFGSRIDIELPKNYQILVKEGDYVDGPNTIIARRMGD
jgi:phosphatidylserine decarboxylase